MSKAKKNEGFEALRAKTKMAKGTFTIALADGTQLGGLELIGIRV